MHEPIRRHGRSDRNRDEEILAVLQADSCKEEDPTAVWMIIPSRWLKMWLLFTHFKVEPSPPGPIDMLSLLKQDPTVIGGWRPKKNLLPPSTKEGEVRPGHYRRITIEAWIQLVDLYGLDGFAIAVVSMRLDHDIFKNIKRADWLN